MTTPLHPPRKDLSLKALDLFDTTARAGSLQAAAQQTGLSISTISHHLRGLETQLGVALFDHSRRPMVLTPKGQVFLRSISGALQMIRAAKAEVTAGHVTEASQLRLGAIEDLDSDITPSLAIALRQVMPQCSFELRTGSSHALIASLRKRHLELAMVTRPLDRLGDLREAPLCRDPFVLVLPAQSGEAPTETVSGHGRLPFLRFSSDLIIARQIEAQLRRLGHDLAPGFECDNTQTLMAMVAQGAGWTIATPLMLARARRFHPQLALHPFPDKSFSRSLILLGTQDCADPVFALISQKLRALLTTHVIAPTHARAPWLTESFKLTE